MISNMNIQAHFMRTAETCVRKVSVELDSEKRLVTYT